MGKLPTELALLVGFTLRGGYRIREIGVSAEPLFDALDRKATAQTTISGRDFRILMEPNLDAAELSITVYHEILEAATVAADICPPKVMDFNEGDFENAANTMYRQFGPATVANLNRMLEEYGF